MRCVEENDELGPRGGVYFKRRYLPEINTIRVPVPPIPFGVIQVNYAVVTFPYNIIFRNLCVVSADRKREQEQWGADHDTRNRAQKHRIGRKIISKHAAAFKKIPRHHADPYDRCDVTPTSDVLKKNVGE